MEPVKASMKLLQSTACYYKPMKLITFTFLFFLVKSITLFLQGNEILKIITLCSTFTLILSRRRRRRSGAGVDLKSFQWNQYDPNVNPEASTTGNSTC